MQKNEEWRAKEYLVAGCRENQTLCQEKALIMKSKIKILSQKLM